MAEPSEKSPAMEQDLDRLTGTAFGRPRTQSIRSNICVTCSGPADAFTDELSRKEYTISGMCQSCQDAVFNSEEDE